MRVGGVHPCRTGVARLGAGAVLAAAGLSHGQVTPGGFGPTLDPPPRAVGVRDSGAAATTSESRPEASGARSGSLESLPLGRPGPAGRVRDAAGRSGPTERAARGAEASEASGSGTMRVVLALAAVLTLAAVAGAVLRVAAQRQGGLRSALGVGGRSPAGLLEILGRYPVARGATLVLLKLDRRVLLLSQTAGGRWGGAAFSTLCEVSDPDEVASILVKARDSEGESMSERFRTLLTRFDRGTDGPSGAGSGIPVVDLTRREDGAVSVLRRRLDSLRGRGSA